MAIRVIVVVEVVMNGDDDESVNEMRQLQCVLGHFCFESVFFLPGSSLVSFSNPLSLVPGEAENLSRSSPFLFVMDLPFFVTSTTAKESNLTVRDNDEAADSETRLQILCFRSRDSDSS